MVWDPGLAEIQSSLSIRSAAAAGQSKGKRRSALFFRVSSPSGDSSIPESGESVTAMRSCLGCAIPDKMSRRSASRKDDESLLSQGGRVPLKEVVADCERRWFEATLKAARSGDVSMQSLVGQMFCSGYGVAPDLKKGRMWLQKSAEVDKEARLLLASMTGEPMNPPSMS